MHWAQAILFCGGLIYAAVDDLKTRTVSNIVYIVIALAGLITISPASLFGGAAGNAPVLPLRRLWPDGRWGLAVSRGGRLCVGSWTGTHGILIYGRRAPAGSRCHACIPALRQSAAKKQPLVPYFAVAFIPAYFL